MAFGLWAYGKEDASLVQGSERILEKMCIE